MEEVGNFLWIALAWLLGGLPTGLWLARWRGAPDPTRTGSRSSGATNVGRLLGWRWGLAVLVLDVLKGVLAALLPFLAGATASQAALCSVAAVLGHCASPFARWKGGKGVATSAGAALALHPTAALLALAPMVLVLLMWRRMAPASLTGVAAFALLAASGDGSLAPPWLGFILLAVVLVTHRQNLGRMWHGVEPTLWGKPTGDPRWRTATEDPLEHGRDRKRV